MPPGPTEEDTMDRIPAGALVVVADGGGARLFRNVGEGRELSLRQEEVLTPQNVNDEGPSGSQPTELRGNEAEEALFAKQLARRLNDDALKNRYAQVVLVADPQTLGQMRPLLHKETQQRLLGELAKTLTNAPIADIEQALG
jgi:protein required for attachment to host cells